jgi:hypothetical protein
MIGYAAFIVAMLVMKLTPQSPLGRWLNLMLVERPLARVAGTDRRRVIFALVMIGILLFASETIMALGSLDLLTAFAWDLTAYLDVMVIAYALAAVARARTGLKWFALRAARPLRRGPRRRARRVRSVRKRRDRASNDDDPVPAWRLAA